jgi:hypothetical protein
MLATYVFDTRVGTRGTAQCELFELAESRNDQEDRGCDSFVLWRRQNQFPFRGTLTSTTRSPLFLWNFYYAGYCSFRNVETKTIPHRVVTLSTLQSQYVFAPRPSKYSQRHLTLNGRTVRIQKLVHIPQYPKNSGTIAIKIIVDLIFGGTISPVSQGWTRRWLIDSWKFSRDWLILERSCKTEAILLAIPTRLTRCLREGYI